MALNAACLLARERGMRMGFLGSVIHQRPSEIWWFCMVLFGFLVCRSRVTVGAPLEVSSWYVRRPAAGLSQELADGLSLQLTIWDQNK